LRRCWCAPRTCGDGQHFAGFQIINPAALFGDKAQTRQSSGILLAQIFKHARMAGLGW